MTFSKKRVLYHIAIVCSASVSRKEGLDVLVAVNVGNSIISVGFFEDFECKLSSSFKISSDIKRTEDEYFSIIKSICNDKGIACDIINGVVISSVVPQLTQKIVKTFSGNLHLIFFLISRRAYL